MQVKVNAGAIKARVNQFADDLDVVLFLPVEGGLLQLKIDSIELSKYDPDSDVIPYDASGADQCVGIHLQEMTE